MDYAIVSILNGLANGSPIFSAIAVFLSVHLIWIIIIVIASIFWMLSPKKRMLASFSAILSAALAWLLNQGIGLVYFRPRPFADHADIHELIAKSSLEKSFPSDHAALAFALAAAVVLVDRRWGIWLFVGAILVSIGRVIVGIHYPSDILAGALVGCLVAYFVHRLIHFILHTRHHSHD